MRARRHLRIAAALLAALLAFAPMPALADEPVEYRADAAVVSFAPDADADSVAALLDTIGATATDLDGTYQLLTLPEGSDVDATIAELLASGLVATAQPDYCYIALPEPDALVVLTAPTYAAPLSSLGLDAQEAATDDPLLDKLWGLDSINAPEAWELVKTEGAVTVALIDVGCDVTHEDIAPNVVDAYNSYNATHDIDDTTDTTDATGHGTHVAGIVGAVADNATGVAGVSHNAGLLPIKVISPDNKAYTSALVDAYDYLLENQSEHNIRVINVSMGFAGDPADYQDNAWIAKIAEADEAGMVTVASAGNSTGTRPVPYDNIPGDCDEVVGVINLQQASGDDDAGNGVARAANSNYNAVGETDKNISAPGSGIVSSDRNSSSVYGGRYGLRSGTSMAAPHVSGTLALMFAANPDVSAADARYALYQSATDLYEEGFDEQSGWGEVNALAAVRDVLTTIQGPDELVQGTEQAYTLDGAVGEWTWSSSDESVATVDADGVVTAVAPGTATLVATSGPESTIRATKQVTVTADDEPAPEPQPQPQPQPEPTPTPSDSGSSNITPSQSGSTATPTATKQSSSTTLALQAQGKGPSMPSTGDTLTFLPFAIILIIVGVVLILRGRRK